MDRIECFEVQITDKDFCSARAYLFNRAGPAFNCPAHGIWHKVEVPIEAVLAHKTEDGLRVGNTILSPFAPLLLGKEWPTHCECGKEVTEQWTFEYNYRMIFKNPATGELFGFNDLPVGAMWVDNGPWYREWKNQYHPKDDGVVTVVLPDNTHWCVDQSSSKGEFWTRTGTVPKVTAYPSIQTPRYHGWLKDGVLSKA